MPRLWAATIEAHRHEVRDAVVETAAALVGEHGLAKVTMAGIAENAGIGRATLYKYVPDVEAILVAWHERHVERHLRALAEARARAAGPMERLDAVLAAYAAIVFERAGGHGSGRRQASREAHRHGARAGPGHSGQPHREEIAALVHRTDHTARAERRLSDLMRDVLRDAAGSGAVRQDVAPEELAAFCLHALAAAGAVPSRAAVDRLVRVTGDALRPARNGPRGGRSARAR